MAVRELATKLKLALLALLLVVGAPLVRADSGPGLPTVPELLALRQEHSLLQARELLEQALVEQQGNAELLCLLAEAHFFYGGLLQGQAAIEQWEKARAYAQDAVELEPDYAPGHYFVAASMGRIGNAKGIFSSLFMVTPMFEHLEIALKLDPDYAWAHFVLSNLYQELPGAPLGRGDRQRALDHARAAWLLEPTEPDFPIHYAKLLIARKELAEAQDVLATALDSSSIRWTPQLQALASELLDELQD